MPVLMDRRLSEYRVPEAGRQAVKRQGDTCDPSADCLDVALINNMPDTALEQTERQFLALLGAAAKDELIRVKFYSLPEIPRADWAQRHMSNCYSEIGDLWVNPPDALIITGTEPRRPNLRDEPYWGALTNVFDWAEENGTPCMLSCLAAHAAVLHIDGIGRQQLIDKCFGVFEHVKASDHPLTKGISFPLRVPHSRWNEVREDALTSCGYRILTRSPVAGVDMFVKQRKSLFLFFQGHPEYGSETLLKEYRRDVGRFLRREREAYPLLPQGYFDSAATRALSSFRKEALLHPREELLSAFPEPLAVTGLTNTWSGIAASIFANWLTYVSVHQARTFWR
jgi:homoserine O-succinyltransferase